MYTPKISEELVPIIYRISRKENQPMTRIVDTFIRDSIKRYIDEKGDDFLEDLYFYYSSKFRKRER